MIESKRIENLEFRPASYLLPKDEWPKNPAWHIDYWYPNAYYGKESDYIKNGDWYEIPEYPGSRIHKDCFKSPESCMAIGSFEYYDGVYEFQFVGDRPVQLTKEERDIFWDLIAYGFKVLNKDENENEELF